MKAAMIWWAWFVHVMHLWRKAVPLTPVSSNTHFLSAQLQSLLFHPFKSKTKLRPQFSSEIMEKAHYLIHRHKPTPPNEHKRKHETFLVFKKENNLEERKDLGDIAHK